MIALEEFWRGERKVLNFQKTMADVEAIRADMLGMIEDAFGSSPQLSVLHTNTERPDHRSGRVPVRDTFSIIAAKISSIFSVFHVKRFTSIEK